MSSLHRYVGTVRFFANHGWLLQPRATPMRTVLIARRELKQARIWVHVIERELAETRAQLHPRLVYAVPAWWLPGALCVHSKESGDWHVYNPPYANGFQFMLGTWLSVGGSAATWVSASPGEQLHRAYLLWRSQGWAPWPNTARACGLR